MFIQNPGVAVLLLLLPSINIVNSEEEGQYTKTEVVIEKTGCDDTLLSTRQEPSVLRCAVLCTYITGCRRYMFDRNSSLCSVFESGEKCFVSEETKPSTVCYRLKSKCKDGSCSRCPMGYYGDRCQYIIKDCMDGFARAIFPKKVIPSFIKPSASGAAIEARCDFKNGRGGTYLLHRGQSCREVDFNRSWSDYKNGFGNPQANHWIGLKAMFDLLQHLGSFSEYRLQILLTGSSSAFRIFYNGVSLTDESQKYRIGFTSSSPHNVYPTEPSYLQSGFSIVNRPFSTFDRDYTSYGCPVRFNSGWWYLDDPDCSLSNVLGRLSNVTSTDRFHWWHDGKRNYDVTSVRFKLMKR